MRIQRVETLNLNNSKKQNNTRPNFQRNWSEHVSWGANYIEKTGKTNFKLFSFPDAKAVFVEVASNISKKFGNIHDRAVKIATAVSGIITAQAINEDSKIYPMNHNGEGVYEANNIDAKAGTSYRFVVVDKNNNINTVKDPYSKKQDDIHGWSEIYNHDNYEWKNTNWLEGKDSRRITRKPDEKFRGLENLVISEINIPTISKEGDFKNAYTMIDKIANDKIANAIEIMPVEGTYSKQWGYDGVDKFAVNKNLGSAKELKELIDYAHGKGLNVIMDMVPNHIGPDGNYLGKTGPYEAGHTSWGSAFNYEGLNNKYVRDYMANAALWWAKEFKVDGLRLDMTQHCHSDYLLKQIVGEVNEHAPEVFLIAEDGRNNKKNVTDISRYNITHEMELRKIDESVDDIANQRWHTYPQEIGFDSEWDFKYIETLQDAVLDINPKVMNDLDNDLKNSLHRVKYVMSHDNIGNNDGTRLISKILSKNLGLFFNVDGYGDCEKGQNAAQSSQRLAELIVSEDFEKLNDEQLRQKLNDCGIRTYISKEHLINTFKTALAKQKLAQGTFMTTPGPKMYFQGDESGDLSHFKFFREFTGERKVRQESDDFKNARIKEKGYDTLEETARPDCIVGRIKYEGYFKNASLQMLEYNKDLKKLLDTNPAISKGDIISTYKDNTHNVHIHQLKFNDEEVLVLKNFGTGFHNKTYEYYGFPQNSTWEEIFNSDDAKYGGGNLTNKGRNDITNLNQHLSMAPNSIVILKKI